MKRILFTLIILLFCTNLQAGYQRGLKYFTYKKYDKAKVELLKAIERNERNGNAYYFLGEIEKLENNFDEAFKYYKLALENPIKKKYRKLAFWNIIVILEQKNDIEEVVKTCKLFWEKTRDSSARKKVDGIINKLLWSNNDAAKAVYVSGLELKSRRKYPEAMEKFFKSIELDSNFLAPKFEIGFHYYNQGNMTDAITYLEPIAEKVPFHSSVNLLLGNIYFSNKSFENATRYFDRVLTYGFNGKKSRYMLHLKRGTSYYNLKNYEKAEYDISQCLELKSKSKKPLFLLSAIYIKTENYESALEILNRLYRLLPKNKEVIYQIGSLYYKLEDPKFSKFFDKLFNLNSTNKKKTPEKYNKAFKILGEYHYSIRSYGRAATILNTIPAEQKSAKHNMMTARANYETKQYQKTIELLEKLSLNNEDSLLLIKAYIKEGDDIKATQMLTPIIDYDQTTRDKALADRTLSPLVKKMIEEQKTRQEEERKRIEEMNRKKEEERKQRELEEQKQLEREREASQQKAATTEVEEKNKTENNSSKGATTTEADGTNNQPAQESAPAAESN